MMTFGFWCREGPKHRICIHTEYPELRATVAWTHRRKNPCMGGRLLIYPDASGDAQLRNKKSIRNYYYHLFGIKGGGNLKRFMLYAFRNCPRKYLVPYLTIGILRRVSGYLLDWFLENLKVSFHYKVKRPEQNEYP